MAVMQRPCRAHPHGSWAVSPRGRRAPALQAPAAASCAGTGPGEARSRHIALRQPAPNPVWNNPWVVPASVAGCLFGSTRDRSAHPPRRHGRAAARIAWPGLTLVAARWTRGSDDVHRT